MNNQLVAMKLPFTDRGVGTAQVSDFEAARSAPGLRAPPADITVTGGDPRRESREIPQQDARRARTSGAGSEAVEGGSNQAQTTSGETGGRGGLGGSSSQQTGRVPAGGGDQQQNQTNWEERLKNVSQVRELFREGNPEELLRDTSLMLHLRSEGMMIRVIYKGRRYGASNATTTINLDAEPAGGRQ